MIQLYISNLYHNFIHIAQKYFSLSNYMIIIYS